MSKSKKTIPNTPATRPSAAQGDGLLHYRLLLAGIFLVNSLFVIPTCLDTSLAPRFLFLSVALLLGIGFLWRDLREHGDWRLQGFDLLFLVWLGMNTASISWAFSWSEAVFFTQKIFLSFVTYWLFRQALQRSEGMVRQVLAWSTVGLTYLVIGILFVQLAQAYGKVGLNNDDLYAYAKGVYGNKGLASDFLFFLLIFNVLLYKDISKKWLVQIGCALVLGLILLLQTRTVYLAVVAGGVSYLLGRAILEPSFRPLFFKKILPLGVLIIGVLLAALALKGRGSSLAERLNPATYLESASANERRFVWYKTELLNEDHDRWLGIGNGSWKFLFPSKNIQGAYRLQEKGVIFTRTHNDYLEIRSELGLIGVTLFVALFGAAFLTAFLALRKIKDAEHQHDILVLMVGLLGYCTIQYFDFPRERIEMQVVLAIFFAWMAYLTREVWAAWPGGSIKKANSIFLGMLVMGLLTCLYVGWLRVSGETHTLKMMQAQANNNWNGVIKEAPLAENAYNQYNDVVLPLQWYKGVAYYQLNDTDNAVEAFKKAYVLNPWSFQVINNYASALVKKGDLRAAIKLYEKTIEINPKYDEGKFNLAFTHYQLGEYDKAMHYVSMVDTIPNPKTDDEKIKNKAILDKQAMFRRQIELKK